MAQDKQHDDDTPKIPKPQKGWRTEQPEPQSTTSSRSFLSGLGLMAVAVIWFGVGNFAWTSSSLIPPSCL
jgi:hypothetical protein